MRVSRLEIRPTPTERPTLVTVPWPVKKSAGRAGVERYADGLTASVGRNPARGVSRCVRRSVPGIVPARVSPARDAPDSTGLGSPEVTHVDISALAFASTYVGCHPPLAGAELDSLKSWPQCLRAESFGSFERPARDVSGGAVRRPVVRECGALPHDTTLQDGPPSGGPSHIGMSTR